MCVSHDPMFQNSATLSVICDGLILLASGVQGDMENCEGLFCQSGNFAQMPLV